VVHNKPANPCGNLNFLCREHIFLDIEFYRTIINCMRKTAILIDDDKDDLEFLEEAIKLVDGSVECIPYLFCDDAVEQLIDKGKFVPHYIFIDINMPRINGAECLRQLRSDPKLRNVLITMLSTSMPPAIAKSLKEHGANYTLQKPSSFHEYPTILKPILHQ
jgi:CheY-like chemotaxis protein